MKTVHPRVRGEHSLSTFMFAAIVGSSPRARGTRSNLPRSRRMRRFIPACAGNTTCAASDGSLNSVHPRVRGEHGSGELRGALLGGSSPRARGTRRRPRRLRRSRRFIPACAGNTHPSGLAFTPPSVHPRVRGEHFMSLPSDENTVGSSPRARGTRLRRPTCARTGRFIPACAGNTWRLFRRWSRRSVHPRVRGEHNAASSIALRNAGSSPRARGTLW